MYKLIFYFAAATLFLFPTFSSSAQQMPVRRVGVLFIGAPIIPELNALREALREAGYVEGKTLLLEITAAKNYDQLYFAAKAFADKKSDLIVTFGSTATAAAKKITQEIPIVFLYGQDPVRQGFVKSMAQPGMNITGLTIAPDFELQGKRLEVFKEAVPVLQRVAVLYNGRPDAEHHAMSFAEVRKTAPSLGVKIVERPVEFTTDLEAALGAITKREADGIFTICAGMFRGLNGQIAAHAIKKRLPLMSCFAEGVAEEGGLLDYQTDRSRMGRRAAWYIDRILKGAKPRDLPVEAPTYFELVINLRTAKQIGVTIPPNLLARAHRVIK